MDSCRENSFLISYSKKELVFGWKVDLPSGVWGWSGTVEGNFTDSGLSGRQFSVDNFCGDDGSEIVGVDGDVKDLGVPFKDSDFFEVWSNDSRENLGKFEMLLLGDEQLSEIRIVVSSDGHDSGVRESDESFLVGARYCWDDWQGSGIVCGVC